MTDGAGLLVALVMVGLFALVLGIASLVILAGDVWARCREYERRHHGEQG